HDHSMKPETMPAEPEQATLAGKNKYIAPCVFLGGETALFASLFGTFIARRNSTAHGPAGEEFFGLGLVFLMTILVLTSSLTSVYAIYHMKNHNYKKMQLWLGVTALLGLGLLGSEIYEFTHYITEYGFTFR